MAIKENCDVCKNFLFVNREAPPGTVYALESLEVVLISAAFEQNISLAFIDDGVYQIHQRPEQQGYPA
ncbi:MAG: DsrE family protein [Thiothrix sp.]